MYSPVYYLYDLYQFDFAKHCTHKHTFTHTHTHTHTLSRTHTFSGISDLA